MPHASNHPNRNGTVRWLTLTLCLALLWLSVPWSVAHADDDATPTADPSLITDLPTPAAGDAEPTDIPAVPTEVPTEEPETTAPTETPTPTADSTEEATATEPERCCFDRVPGHPEHPGYGHRQRGGHDHR